MTSPPQTPDIYESDSWHLSLPALPPSSNTTPFYEDEEQDAYPYHTDLPYIPPYSSGSDGSFSSAESVDEPHEALTPSPSPTSFGRRKLKPFMLSPNAPIFTPHQNFSSSPTQMMEQEQYTHVPVLQHPQAPRRAVDTMNHFVPSTQARTRRSRSRRTKSFSPTPISFTSAMVESARPDPTNSKEALKLHLELDLNIHVEIKARVHGDVTLSLMD